MRYFFGCKDILFRFYSETDFSFFSNKKGADNFSAFSFSFLLLFKDLSSKTDNKWNLCFLYQWQ